MSTHSGRAHSDRASFSRPVLLRGVPQTRWFADGPITVVIAEESYLIRESLVYMLGGHDRVEIVAVCSDSAALEFAIAWERPRVVLTETRMLGSTPSEGIEFAARLRRTNPYVAVVVLARGADAGREERGFALYGRDRARPHGDRSAAMMPAYPSWWLSILHARRAGHLRADRVRPPYLGQLIDRWSSRQEARGEAPCCSV
jgi:CheY-like chemotaxis protein